MIPQINLSSVSSNAHKFCGIPSFIICRDKSKCNDERNGSSGTHFNVRTCVVCDSFVQ